VPFERPHGEFDAGAEALSLAREDAQVDRRVGVGGEGGNGGEMVVLGRGAEVDRRPLRAAPGRRQRRARVVDGFDDVSKGRERRLGEWERRDADSGGSGSRRRCGCWQSRAACAGGWRRATGGRPCAATDQSDALDAAVWPNCQPDVSDRLGRRIEGVVVLPVRAELRPRQQWSPDGLFARYRLAGVSTVQLA
jgi:hypothetical protein